jgi:hypothetical protein
MQLLVLFDVSQEVVTIGCLDTERDSIATPHVIMCSQMDRHFDFEVTNATTK